MNYHQYTFTTQVQTEILTGAYQQDPLSLFAHLTTDKQHCLLLESAEISDKRQLKSILLVDSSIKIECHGHRVDLYALNNDGDALLKKLKTYFVTPQFHQQIQVTDSHDSAKVPERTVSQCHLFFAQPDSQLDEASRLLALNPFEVLRTLQNMAPNSVSPYATFLGGAFAFDLIGVSEQLPEVQDSANQCPDYVFYLAQSLVLIDHQQQTTEFISNSFSAEQDSQVKQGLIDLHKQCQLLADNANKNTGIHDGKSNNMDFDQSTPANLPVDVNVSDNEFCQQVDTLKEHIRAGDIFQVVPSRTFSIHCPDTVQAYRQLKKTNPSPYMFYLKDECFELFGASPESALKFTAANRQVELYPIAGTRGRGFKNDGSYSTDLDGRIELELRNDIKEKAEHLMLVDLARNDIARVSVGGTRHVAELLKVDRYSHVMHLVSRVVGTLQNELDALHAYQACMNMGTLSGAPKVRATELIRQFEGQRRGSYGGAVGYLNADGDMDTCIVIRSAFVQDNTAYIQAGAGVVYDSDPQAEADETRQKAQAVIKAIQLAYRQTSTNAKEAV
ncbi:anthranilate synthase component 1 [Thalassotalea litorea]|uniref:Anthranilate synthase component 1 n=1 Tax=Thalassotalea litorea TaxID=2020715 RepID=A0A5R9IF60_9GAMM|nr:anthranilate synthase component 1 [Thalassotalea litorea]TLU64165.1 anthranilate synthase component 1 [Thalassotalea litorea]